jgi:hypothetical protein
VGGEQREPPLRVLEVEQQGEAEGGGVERAAVAAKISRTGATKGVKASPPMTAIAARGNSVAWKQEGIRGTVEGEHLGAGSCTGDQGNPRRDSGELEIGECSTDPRVERGEGDGDGPIRLGVGKDNDFWGSIVRAGDCAFLDSAVVERFV